MLFPAYMPSTPRHVYHSVSSLFSPHLFSRGTHRTYWPRNGVDICFCPFVGGMLFFLYHVYIVKGRFLLRLFDGWLLSCCLFVVGLFYFFNILDIKNLDWRLWSFTNLGRRFKITEYIGYIYFICWYLVVLRTVHILGLLLGRVLSYCGLYYCCVAALLHHVGKYTVLVEQLNRRA